MQTQHFDFDFTNFYAYGNISIKVDNLKKYVAL